MDFNFYKKYLIEYLNKCGCKAERGLIRCFSPNHNDKNPSCEVFEDHFVCYSGNCGIHGDIYDAVEILEGITDKKEQYTHLEKIFGSNFSPAPLAKATKEKETFTPNKESCTIFENYLKAHKNKEKPILDFLDQRAKNATNNQIQQYPEPIRSKMVNFFLYWQGLQQARAGANFPASVLRTAGIPQEKKETGISQWDHSGIIIKLGQGYKLHFYDSNNTCQKRGSKGCQTFPMPCSEITAEEIILVEGEMDAIASTAAGIKNVYSTGGTNGLTGPKIEKYLINSPVKTITILYDNDEAGKKASGLIPYTQEDKTKQSLPERLKKSGFTGTIKIAQLTKYKDPDEAILNNDLIHLADAIANATEWLPLEKTNETKTEKKQTTQKKEIQRGTLTLKEVQSLCKDKTLPITTLDPEDVQPFIDAIINAVQPELELATKEILRNWGAKETQLKKAHKKEPYYLVTLARKYNLSYYYINKIENATITKNELEQYTDGSQYPLVEIDYKQLDGTKDLKTFIYKRGEKSAAGLLARVLAGKFIYIETEKKYYFFNGLIWQRKSEVTDIAYNILYTIIKHYAHNTEDEDQTRIKALNTCLSKIEEFKFLNTVMKALAEKPAIFREQITFDGPQIAETLTLQDGVIDFSGKQIRYRNATANEYRRKVLPYTVDQVRENKTPENFLKFMKGNFRNDDTLETLMYYLSLIPSRRAQFKVGGIFVGVAHTGKTTTMKIISEIYPEMTTPIPREMIMSQGRYSSSNGPNPYMARLEGAGAGISDETKRNDSLNGALWKQLTGGGMLTARGMYAMPRDFMPTAQILILTNYSPKFDGKDQATIDRMVVVPFSVQHKKGEEGTMEENDLLDLLRPEFPLVVKLFAEYYINLKHKHKSKIPLSKECEAYKADYVENQETDLDRFVSNNIEFIKDENCWVTLKDVYSRFCQFNQIELDQNGKPIDKESWSQSKFTRYFKGDYNEVRIKQRKINGYPEQICINMRLKDWEQAPAQTQNQTQTQQNLFTREPPFETYENEDDDEENPWD